MKKNFYRVISWLLALTLICSMTFSGGIPVAHAAEDYTMVSVDVQNAKAATVDGVDLKGTYVKTVGDVWNIKAEPAVGCSLSVKADGVTVVADADNIYHITITNNLTISVVGTDITAPGTPTTTRQESGWTQAAVYKISVADNIAVTGCTLTDTAGNVSVLQADADGTYTATITANGTYTAVAVDAVGLSASAQIIENQVDTVPPVVVGLERLTTGLAQEAAYKLTVEDAESDIAEVVVVGDGSDVPATKTADGEYTFTIKTSNACTVKVVDNAGNTATQTITDTEVDAEPPVISDPVRQKTGWQQETSTYSFTVADTKTSVSSVTYNAGGSGEQTLTPVDGVYTITVEDNCSVTITATDTLGNSGTKSFDESQIDKTAPAVTTAVREQSGWAQKPAYTFTVSDTGSGVETVTVEGPSETQTVTPDGNGVCRVEVSANGTYTITATDKTGREKTSQFTETMVDTVPPSVTNISRSTETWSQSAIYSFQVADSQSGVQSVAVLFSGHEQTVNEVAEGVYSFQASDNGAYSIVVTDVAGNTDTVSVNEALIDLTPPVIQDPVTQQTWDATQNTVTVKITDNGELISVKVTDATGKEYTALDKGDGNFASILDTNGTYTITAIDRAGNSDTATFVVDRIDVDAPTKPALYSSANEQYVNIDVTLTANATDTQSGVAAYWYSTESSIFNEESWEKMDLVGTTGTLLLTTEQDCTYYVVAQDNVGRVSEVATITVSIDKTAPADIIVSYSTNEESGYNRIVNGKYIFNDVVGFTATAQDPASGVVKYEYRIVGDNDGTDWITVETGEAGICPIISDLEDGIYTVSVRVYDLTGNCSDEITVLQDDMPVQCIIENTPVDDIERSTAPDVSAKTQSGNYSGDWTAETVTMEISGCNAISGVDYYEFRVDYANSSISDTQWDRVPVAGDTAQLTVSVDTNATYYFRAVSNAGNISLVTKQIVKVQKSLPKAATLLPEAATGTNGWYTQYPDYGIRLPVQDTYAAPVHYVITYDHNGAAGETITYDGTNAPLVSQDGIWNITITATDAAGNMNTNETSVANFKVDTVVPIPLDVTLDGASILIYNSDGTIGWNDVLIQDGTVSSDFSIFKNTDVSIQAYADGGASGLADIYYMVAANNVGITGGTWTKLEGSLNLTPDAKYHVYFKAVDGAGNTTYFSGKSFILDNSAPVGIGSDSLTLVPQDSNKSAHGVYFGDVTVAVQVQDPMIGSNEAFAGLETVTYRIYKDGEISQSGQLYPGTGKTTTKESRIQSWSGILTINAALSNSNHIVVEVTATDVAGNTKTSRIEDGVIRIDLDKPVMSSEYDNNAETVMFDGNACFTGGRTLTVTVTERNFLSAESVVTVKDTDTGKIVNYTWESVGNTHIAVIPVTEDGHYEVSAVVTDAAGNSTTVMGFAEATVGAISFVIDNTAPVIAVSYDNNAANQGIYFDTARTVAITVTERNFNPENVEVRFLVEREDGTTVAMPVGKWASEGNVHTAYVTCDAEGIYSVSVAGTDALGNKAENVKYNGTAAKKFVVDSHIAAPVFTDVADGCAYAGAIIPKATILDTNLYTVSVQLLRTRRNEIGVDVTQEMGLNEVIWETIHGGKEASMDIFPEGQGIDGVYTLIVRCEDKAGNTSESSVTFSVNRYGSTYVYEAKLVEVMGTYLQSLTGDLIITEYNPSGLVAGSARVYITRDGVPVSNPIYTVTPALNGKEVPGESGWYEYRYVISAENFAEDGVYEIVISTQDVAGNVPENTSEDMAIRFAVDTEVPQLTSVVGMEEKIYKADAIPVTLTALDNVALESIVIYLDGEELARWDEIDTYFESTTFTIPSGLEHHVRIVVTDKAGNVLDTDSENFTPGYAFQEKVTVSTNVFLRFYANKPLFYCTVCAVAVVITVSFITLLFKKKKRDNEENEEHEEN